LVRAEIFKDTLLLFQTRSQYIPIPIGELSAAHRSALCELLDRRGLLPPTRSRANLWTTADPDHR
jgi:hypothetical protein